MATAAPTHCPPPLDPSSTKRPDGRLPNQLRPLKAELGTLNRADGSARFALGNTSVVAAVYGPGIPRYQRKERIEGATVEVTCRPHRGQATSTDREREALIRRVLEESIKVAQYPRTCIHVILQLVDDDGGALAVLTMAAVLGVMNAGVEMSYIPLSIPAAAASETGTIILDPTAAEEKAAKAIMSLTLDSVENGLVSCHAVGLMEPQAFILALTQAQGASRALLAFIRATIEEHTKRTNKYAP